MRAHNTVTYFGSVITIQHIHSLCSTPRFFFLSLSFLLLINFSFLTFLFVGFSSFLFSTWKTYGQRRRLKANLTEAEGRLVSELEAELSRVKSDLDAAGQEEEKMKEEERVVSEELSQSETQVRSLRSQMDQLTQEIKQANLQSLSIAPADDLKILLEGNILSS